MALSTKDLSPLFAALAGHTSPADVIPVSPEMKDALHLVSQRLRLQAVDRLPTGAQRLSCAIFSTPLLPTAILYAPFQKDRLAIVEWLHLPHTPSRKLYPLIEAVADLFSKARQRCCQLTGSDIDSVYFPFPQGDMDKLLQLSAPFQAAFADFLGTVLPNPPKDKRLTFLSLVPYTLTTCFVDLPLPNAQTIFTDGSSTRGVVSWQDSEGSWLSRFTSAHSSAQRSELAAVILAFELFACDEFNLIVDTQYVYRLLVHLPYSYLSPSMDKELYAMFSRLQDLLQHQTLSCFVSHIRSHTGLPGFLAEGNVVADSSLKQQDTVYHLFDDPIASHHMFHQSAKVLHKMFSIPMSQARDIVTTCPCCNTSQLNLPFDAVNPRGEQANDLWQMDVTQVPLLAPLSKLHLTVDTFSGFIWATPLRGETSRHVIQHCIRTFAVMGRPKFLKTDNGPAYTSSAFTDFCNQWGIQLKHGIPFNSTGQAIVERAHLMFKSLLQKQTSGKGVPVAEISSVVARVLYTLNFLLFPHNRNHTPVQLHFRSKEQLPRPLVSYRQPPDPAWKGPVPLITWGRGYAAIALDKGAIWIPARCVRPWRDPVSS